MARTLIPSASIHQLASQIITVTAGTATLTFQAIDASLGNSVPCTGKEIILVWNTDSVAGTITFTAAPDRPYGRTGAITAYSVAATSLATFGPFSLEGWLQSDNQLYINGSAATMKVAVLRIP